MTPLAQPTPEDETAGFVIEHSRRVFDGRIISVEVDSVRMPDGQLGEREVVRHPGAVGVVALDDDDRVVMVRQFRHPVRQFLLELPAGLLDVDGESALKGAQRELVEEAGLAASEWSVLLDLQTSPGMSDEAIRIFLATGLSDAHDPSFEASHEESTMTVERVPLENAVELALSGQLTNAAAVAGVLAAHVARTAGFGNLRPADATWAARPTRADRAAD